MYVHNNLELLEWIASIIYMGFIYWMMGNDIDIMGVYDIFEWINSLSDKGALEYTCLLKTRHIHTHSMCMFCNPTLIPFLYIDMVQDN